MADIEKVIKGLEVCAHCESGFFCSDCPYEATNERNCIEFLAEDALELLKSQLQIVRCKECKYGEQSTDISEHFKLCLLTGKINANRWFCADGERK